MIHVENILESESIVKSCNFSIENVAYVLHWTISLTSMFYSEICRTNTKTRHSLNPGDDVNSCKHRQHILGVNSLLCAPWLLRRLLFDLCRQLLDSSLQHKITASALLKSQTVIKTFGEEQAVVTQVLESKNDDLLIETEKL